LYELNTYEPFMLKIMCWDDLSKKIWGSIIYAQRKIMTKIENEDFEKMST